jgi:sensor histidine kinase regulating citrate/malate metabolism
MEQQQLAGERARLADMQSSYLTLRTWRHDYHNHISIINYYVEQEEWDALRAYLGELNEQLPMPSMSVCTENLVFNALANTKMLLAVQSGTDLQVEADLPESMPLDDVTFCALLGNLLDNALEAAKRLPSDSKPWIRLSAQLSAETFTLRVTNSADGTYIFSRNRLLSRKAEPNHGIGLMRVQQIVQSLDGRLTLTPEQDTFEALVQIPCSIAEN